MGYLTIFPNPGDSLLVIVLGLVALLALLALVVVLSYRSGKNAGGRGDGTVSAAPAIVSASSATAESSDDENEIAAVIAAVVAMLTAEKTLIAAEPAAAKIEGFYVRRVKRTASANSWGKAGREELLSSKNFN